MTRLAATLSALFLPLTAAHAQMMQMVLMPPSETEVGTPLDRTEFEGVDTNGDGYEELVISGPRYDEQDPQFSKVHVFSSANANDDVIIVGEQGNDLFGFRAVGIPDVSLNGNHDLVISAPYWKDSGGNAVGRVYVVQGSDGTILHTLQGTTTNALFGYAVAAVGDLTGDGVTEIAVGAPHAGAYQEGAAYIYNGLTGTIIDTIQATVRGGYFGAAVSTAGDLNSDGYSDFVVGAPGGDWRQLGKAYVYSGQTRSVICEISGIERYGRFGYFVAGGEDTTGNGQLDIVVSAPSAANVNPVSSGSSEPYSHGQVYVFSAGSVLGSGGQLTATSAALTIQPSHEGDADFGYFLQIGNDVSDDQLPDLVIGSNYEGSSAFPPENLTTRINVISGVNGAVIQTYGMDEDVEASVQYYQVEPAIVGCYCYGCGCVDSPCEDCVWNVIQKHNIRWDEAMRKSKWVAWGGGAGCVITVLIAPPLGVPVCIGWTGAFWHYYISVPGDLRVQLCEEYIDCFNEQGCLSPTCPW